MVSFITIHLSTVNSIPAAACKSALLYVVVSASLLHRNFKHFQLKIHTATQKIYSIHFYIFIKYRLQCLCLLTHGVQTKAHRNDCSRLVWWII